MGTNDTSPEVEIEVTPEMVAAGIHAYSEHDGIVLSDLVATVYRKMQAAKKRSLDD